MPNFGRLNFKRRVIDHRAFYDQHDILNKSPFTRGYMKAFQQRAYRLFVNGYFPYMALYILTIGTFALGGATLLQHYYPRKSAFGYRINHSFRDIDWVGRYLNDHEETPKFDRLYNTYSLEAEKEE